MSAATAVRARLASRAGSHWPALAALIDAGRVIAAANVPPPRARACRCGARAIAVMDDDHKRGRPAGPPRCLECGRPIDLPGPIGPERRHGGRR